MTVARVASAESIRTATTDPYTFSYAGGTPQGIAIAVVHGVSGTALVTSVSYGGVPLDLIVEAADTTTEPGNAQIWFLGSGVPAGTQTVSADLTSASGTDVHFVVWELSGADDLEIVDSDLINDNVANPTVTLSASGRNKISLCAMYGGGAAPGGTLATGNTLDHTHDLGAFYSQTCYETTVSNANHTIGWSSLGTDDVALVAIAVSEVVAPQALTGTLFTKAPTFNTGVVAATRTVAGVLFAEVPTFGVGTITPSVVTLHGALLSNTPSFPTGAVVATRTISGVLFTKASTFPTGTVLSYTNPVVVELDDLGAPGTDLNHFLRAHARTDAGTGFIRVRLFQAATFIAGFEFEPTGTFATYSYELLEAEAVLITDYNDLQIHIDLRATTTPFTPEIDWVDLLRPAATGGSLVGEVFQNTPIFNAGVVTTLSTITGSLFTVTPLFEQGVVEVPPNPPQILSGVLFANASTFSTGAVTVGAVTLTGTLLTVTSGFFQGNVIQVVAAGTLFTKTPTFFTGSIAAIYNLTGILFDKGPSFFTGAVTATRTLAGTLFTKASTFSAGTVTVGAVTLTGNLFTKAPAFPQGQLTQVGGPVILGGTLFAKTPTFPQGVVSTGVVALTGSLFAKAATFNVGDITALRTLNGVLFQKAPTFPIGAVTPDQILVGVLFQSAPTFPQGLVALAGSVTGVLFVSTPSFFVGVVTVAAPSFWTPNPAGYTVNPVAFVRVGAPGPSPWGAELSGDLLELAPLFPVGSVS